MNIREAKEEVKNTVRAYLAKDEEGAYLIPVEKQRPLLLIGPPGIGKTAIMEQVAQEMGVNLVSYTITHHTRQSAIGLPMIEHKNFGGKDYAVTEYTMSEIIASVYESIEESGISEGILFLDEINCVSETLAPTMLQFLQYKTFGGHKVPDGFVIVTAGNPPEYNKSVREFDIVTLDRVRRINITANAEVWRHYAINAGVHGAILAYLAIHPNHFYSMRTDIEDRQFVTARGWEDLSRMIKACERLDIPVTEGIVEEYLQDREIARSFADYYGLYQKYKDTFRIQDVLAGRFPEDHEALSRAPFDEKISLIGLLHDALSVRFASYVKHVHQTAMQKRQTPEGEPEKNVEKIQIQESSISLQNEIDETSQQLTNALNFLAEVYGENQEMVLFLTDLSASEDALTFISECGNDAYFRYSKLLLMQDRREALQDEARTLLHS